MKIGMDEKKLSERDKKLFKIFKFMAKFSFASIFLHLLLWHHFTAYHLQLIFACYPAKFLSYFKKSEEIYCKGAAIHTKEFDLFIIPDCTGWKSFLAIFGLVVATENIDLKNRLIGILLAIPYVFGINFARITTTLYVGLKCGVNTMELIHSILWKLGLMVAVLIYWYFWFKKSIKVKYLFEYNKQGDSI